MHVCDKGDVRYVASLEGQIDPGGEVTVERERRLRISATIGPTMAIRKYGIGLVTVFTRIGTVSEPRRDQVQVQVK
jgi:hypothetical protein